MVIRLEKLSGALPGAVLSGDPSVEIVGVEYDSRRIGPGSLFCAVRGTRLDGREFIGRAAAAGAAAVMVDSDLSSDPGLPVLRVPDVRQGMALAAAELYGRPADGLTMVGVTGTNGKTTTTYLLESILRAAGFRPGVIGTVSVRFEDSDIPASLTTPEGPDLQRFLAEMKTSGATHVVMETASHALDLSRVAGCAFDVGIFTNLSQDHLDYHKDFESYFQAKRLLFTRYLNGSKLAEGPRAVVNIDDQYGRRLARELGAKALTVSLRDAADLRAESFGADRSGLKARLDLAGKTVEINSRMLGVINLYNIMTAAGAALALGIRPQDVVAGVEGQKGVPGRLERVGDNDDFLVLVDYSHTPDSLESALAVVRELGPKRILCVFGCGGDRDRGKRPLMGRAAGQGAELAVVTSDNPRTEDPLAIINEIEPGLSQLGLSRVEADDLNASFNSGNYTVVPDRAQAIRLAVRLMEPGDVLVVAGKGHEDYQILGLEKIHFDDREVAGEALKAEGKF